MSEELKPCPFCGGVDVEKVMGLVKEYGRLEAKTGGALDGVLAKKSSDTLAQISALLTPVGDGWIAVGDRMPEAGKGVLAHYKNSAGYGRIVRAFYAPKHTLEANSYDDDGQFDYDEATDTAYLPEGWLEKIDNWGDFSSIYIVEGEVTHWQPLPPAPRRDKEGGEVVSRQLALHLPGGVEHGPLFARLRERTSPNPTTGGPTCRWNNRSFSMSDPKITEVNLREIEKAIARVPAGWWKLMGPGADLPGYAILAQQGVPELVITHDQREVLYLLFVAQPEILRRLIAEVRGAAELKSSLQAISVAQATLREDLHYVVRLLQDIRWMVKGIADRNETTGKRELAELDAVIARYTAPVH